MEKDNPTEKLDTNTALPNFVELAKNTELNPQNSINIVRTIFNLSQYLTKIGYRR
jgi:hypothetical protein